MGRFRDFDAERAERDIEPLTLDLFEQTWTLPASAPAAVVLSVGKLIADLRAEHGNDADVNQLDVSDEAAIAICRDMFPAEVLDAWLKLGIEMEGPGGLLDVMKWALEEWNVVEQIADVDGEPAPEVPAPPGATPPPSTS